MGELSRYRFLDNTVAKAALLDANLLTLRLSVRTDPDLLKTFKRINQFVLEDALLLEWILEQFPVIVTTAYVLAEASNLGNSLHGVTRNAWFLQLASYRFVDGRATCLYKPHRSTYRDGSIRSGGQRLSPLVNVGGGHHHGTAALRLPAVAKEKCTQLLRC